MKAIKCLGTLLLAATGMSINSCSSKSELDADLIEYMPVQVDEGGNWSFVSPTGEIKYPDEFKVQPSAIVEGYFSVRENDGYTLYKADSKPVAVEGCEGLVAVGYMSDGLVPVTKPGERITVIDGNGKTKFTLNPIDGKEIVNSDTNLSDGLLVVVNEDNLSGYVDSEGKVVVKPKYTRARPFKDERALVQKGEGDDAAFYVIDKSGETVFAFGSKYSLGWISYMEDMLVVKDSNDRVVFLDKNGDQKLKCPAKVKYVPQYNADYIVFATDDGQYGLLNFKGETVIRAKYDELTLLNNGDLMCATSDGKRTIRNTNDEELYDLEEYQYAGELGQFRAGQFRHIIYLLDSQWKPIPGAEFYNVSDNLFVCHGVETDYFNRESVFNTVIDMIGDNGVDKYTFGTPAAAMFDEPEDHTYTYDAMLPDLEKNGFRYGITAQAFFSECMATSEFDLDTYRYKYSWNPDSKLYRIVLYIETQTDWTADDSEAFVKAFEKKGYQLADKTKSGNTVFACLKKGNNVATLTSDSSGCKITVADGEVVEEPICEAAEEVVDEEVVEEAVEYIP